MIQELKETQMNIIQELKDKHRFTDKQLAEYLGTPWVTVRSWRIGTRKPNNAALRLISIYKLLEVVHAATHASLVERAKKSSRPQASE